MTPKPRTAADFSRISTDENSYDPIMGEGDEVYRARLVDIITQNGADAMGAAEILAQKQLIEEGGLNSGTAELDVAILVAHRAMDLVGNRASRV